MHPTSLEAMLPGATVRVTTRVAGIFPAGLLTVHADATPHEVPGTIHVTVPLNGGERTAGLVAIPWPQLVLLIVLVAAGLGSWLFLRRRRRGHAVALAAAVERGRQEARERLAAVGGRPDDESQDDPAADPE